MTFEIGNNKARRENGNQQIKTREQLKFDWYRHGKKMESCITAIYRMKIKFPRERPRGTARNKLSQLEVLATDTSTHKRGRVCH